MAYEERQKKQERLKTVTEQLIQKENSDQEEAEELLWEVLRDLQGTEFRTAKGLDFTYTIKGNEMFVSRKDKSLTRATVQLAFYTAIDLQRKGERITGPKKLKTFGASYLYPVFIRLGIIN